MKVWIDQDLCTGDGLCVEICPSVFGMHDDGLAYVKEVTWRSISGAEASVGEPVLKGPTGLAEVPDAMVDDVIESAEACPGECIFVEAE